MRNAPSTNRNSTWRCTAGCGRESNTGHAGPMWTLNAASVTIPLDKGGKTSHVPLNTTALRALAELHRQRSHIEFVSGGARTPRAWFEAAVKAPRSRGFTWHCLRHRFASRLVMSGADRRTVAELLGDKTLTIVMRYAHLAPDYKLAAVERMASSIQDSIISTKLTPTPERQVAPGTRMVQ